MLFFLLTLLQLDPRGNSLGSEGQLSPLCSPTLASLLGSKQPPIVILSNIQLGTELVGVTVGEAQNPRKTIPRAIKLTFWRIMVFYVLSVFL